MTARRLVTIDFLPDSPLRHLDHDAVICVDVMRATTTLVTAAAQGRRAYPAATVEKAQAIAARLRNPLLAGEVSGGKPDGFELGNSPHAIADRSDWDRPLVLVSRSGTPLLANAEACRAVYVSCFRNMTATVDWVTTRHDRVAVLGAGSHGELRCEDQMATAWIAEKLIQSGFDTENAQTADLVERWSGTSVTLVGWGNSADYLRRSNQLEDLRFVQGHVDDLDMVCRYEKGELVVADQDVPTASLRPLVPARGESTCYVAQPSLQPRTSREAWA